MIDSWPIQVAFRTKLLSISGIPDEENRAWENKNFTPKNDTPWIRETLLPGGERLTANNEIQQVGIMQYGYFVPIGSSVKDAKNLADTIKHVFKPCTVLDGFVRVDRAEVSPGSRGISGFVSESGSSPWYHLPIQLSYITFSTNT